MPRLHSTPKEWLEKNSLKGFSKASGKKKNTINNKLITTRQSFREREFLQELELQRSPKENSTAGTLKRWVGPCHIISHSECLATAILLHYHNYRDTLSV